MNAPPNQTAFAPFEEPFAVPKFLESKKQWIGWRLGQEPKLVDGKLKFDKKPVCINTGSGVGYTRSENQVSYDEALAAVGRLKLSGVGFVVMPDDELSGVDLDGCVDVTTGEIALWAQKKALDFKESYAEFSPSGEGIRLWALGKVAKPMPPNKSGVEIYASGRFLTFTGRHVPGAPWDIKPAPKTIAALTAHWKEGEAKKSSASQSGAGKAAGGAQEPAGEAGAAAGDDDAGAEAFRRYSSYANYQETRGGEINTLAFASIEAWAPELLPDGELQATGAWRVKAAKLGRLDLQEDLSIHPDGAVYYGVNQEDHRKGKRSAIDLVIQFGLGLNGLDNAEKLKAALADPANFNAASWWLAERLGITREEFDRMGRESKAKADELEVQNRWNELRKALHWPSAAKVINAGGTGNVTTGRHAGFATFGKDASSGNAIGRAWISDRHLRGLVTVTNGVPGQGKSTLLAAYVNMVAAEKPTLAGLTKILRAGACVYIAADGEKRDEFKRKDEAFRTFHGLTNNDFPHRVHVLDDTGPLVEKHGDAWVPSKWIIALAPKLAEMREQERLAIIVMDTLASMSGGGKLSDEQDMQAVMEVAKMVAYELNCAVDIVNHLTKGGAKSDPQSMDAGAGARPLTAVPRIVDNVLSPLKGLVQMFRAKGSYRRTARQGRRSSSGNRSKSQSTTMTRACSPGQTWRKSASSSRPAESPSSPSRTTRRSTRCGGRNSPRS